MSKFKPMLAETLEDEHLSSLRLPKLVSVKLDGIRCLVHPEHGVISRKLKDIPNTYIRETLHAETARMGLTCLDGELVVGDLTSPDFDFGSVTSGIMSRGGEPDFTYWVFDSFADPEVPYVERWPTVSRIIRDFQSPFIKVLDQTMVEDVATLLDYEDKILQQGHEGVMVRCPYGRYKFNRSTLKEQLLLKRKPFEDAEATIIGFQEQMENTNEATIDELGHTKRSSHQAGMVPKGTLGKFVVWSDTFGEFEIGGGRGMTSDLRREIWENQSQYKNRQITFTYQKIGMKDKPRIPQFKAFREGY